MKTYNESIDWQWHLSQIRIGRNGKIRLPHISIDITKGCNMRCEHCSHLSPLLHGYFPAAGLLDAMQSWSKKLQPKRFAVLGGEPLLHPQFKAIVLTAWKCWEKSEIVVVSNGTLLEQLDNVFLETIGNLKRIRFDISQHIESTKWNRLFIQERKRFRNYKIPFTLRKAYSKWMVIYQQDKNKRYIPYQSLPQQAWDVCECRSFYKIHENKLWYCSRFASEYVLVKEHVFGKEWNTVLLHQPMTLADSQEDILNYLRQQALPECSMCPDTIQYVKQRQMGGANE